MTTDEIMALVNAHALIFARNDEEGFVKSHKAIEAALKEREAAAAAVPEVPEVPDGYRLVAVKGFDDLVYWMDRCDSKGHLENCADLIEPWAAFDYRNITQPPKEPA